MVKSLNSIFIAVYSLVFITSVWFGIYWIVTRGVSTMFDDLDEFILAVFYIVVLLFSVFMHIKLRNKKSSIPNKICAVFTSINTISIMGIILLSFGGVGDSGLFFAGWMFIVLVFWLISLLSGVITLRIPN